MGTYNLPPLKTLKEFFVPVSFGTEMIIESGQRAPGAKINASTDEAGISFFVPSDFSSIIETVVVRASQGVQTSRFNYFSSYFAISESQTNHSGSLLDQDQAEINGRTYEQDISEILSALAAGDHVGIRVSGDATNTPNDIIHGVRFKYS